MLFSSSDSTRSNKKGLSYSSNPSAFLNPLASPYGRLVRPLNPEEVASRLNENERKLLIALKSSETSSTSTLSLVLGLSKDAIEKASSWAETKGVVSFREEVSKFFKLTEEGQK